MVFRVRKVRLKDHLDFSRLKRAFRATGLNGTSMEWYNPRRLQLSFPAGVGFR